MTTPVSSHRQVLAAVALFAGTVMFSATALGAGAPSSSSDKMVGTASPSSATAAPGVAAGHFGGPGTRPLLAAGAPARSGQRRLPVATNPSASIAPSAAFEAACLSAARTITACNVAALAAIDSARAGEGYGPLGLPANYQSMTRANQLLVVADAERTSRGLPKFTQVASLDLLALAGARATTDPAGPNNSTWASNVSWGYPTALTADFAWMYDDGTNSPNVDCAHAGAAGCWGHRQNVLSPWAGQAGAAAVSTPQGWVLTELFVQQP